MTKRQARAGGEQGANGEWYQGGEFINTVAANPKGQAKVRKVATRRQEIERGVWAVGADGAVAIYPQLAGLHPRDRQTNTFGRCPETMAEQWGVEGVKRNNALADRYNAGERWM